MRNTPSTQALAPVREVKARITFTDYRLRFAYVPTSEIPSDYDLWDSSDFGTGILQVARKVSDAANLYFRYITDPNAVWPGWSTLACTSVYHLALHAGRLFVSTATGLATYDFNGTFFGAATTYTKYASSLIAPVALDEIYVLTYTVGTPFSWGKVLKANLTTSVEDLWYGRLYDTTPAKRFDAIRIGTDDYIYAGEEAGKRTVYLHHDAAWSEKRYVIPLDVVDDVSMFRLSGATVINGKAIVTGMLARSWGPAMHIYTFGPERYTLGRDLYIGAQNTGGSGKFHLVGATLWFVGPGVVYKAPATELVGYSNPDLVFQTEAIGNIRLSTASNQPYNLTMDLKSDISHATIRPGSKVKLETIVNGEVSDIGNYSLDAIIRPTDETGPSISLACRSWALKELTNWESDAPYDYWSQTKLSSNPQDMAKVIRASGQWKSENNMLTTYDLNKDGILYVSAKACHNGTMRAKFRRLAGDWNSRFGVGVNYYVEGKAECAVRLGKNTENILESDYGQNGVFAIFGKKEHNGAAGVALYILNQNVWTKLTSAAVTLGDGSTYWAQIRFLDGLCQVHYRLDANSTWTKVLEHTIERTDILPWKVDTMGRGAIFARNETGSVDVQTILGNLIAVKDNTAFPISETLIVDEEIIQYNGKSNPMPWDVNYTQVELSPLIVGDLVTTSINNNEAPVNVGTPTSQKVRQKLNNMTKYVANTAAGCVMLRLYKVGLPTDSVKVSLYNSAMVLRGSATVNSADIPDYPTNENVGDDWTIRRWFNVTLPKMIPAVTDYLVVERTGAMDADNYYRLGAHTSGGATYACDTHNGTAWGTTTTQRIFGRLFQFLSNSLSLYELYYAQPAPANYWKDFAVKFKTIKGYKDADGRIFAGSVYPDSWHTITGSTASSSLCTVGTVPAQQPCRPGDHYPTLKISARGVNNTAQTLHDGSTAYIYRPGPFIYISGAEYFSSENDISLEGMTREIAAKAGVQSVTSSALYAGTLKPNLSTLSLQRKNIIADVTIPDTLNGTVIVEARKPTPATDGVSVMFFNGSLICGQATYTPDNGIGGKYTFSFFDELNRAADGTITYTVYVSVWRNGTYLISFVTSDAGNGEYFTIKGQATNDVTVSISEACMRVDNWILDNGKKGAQLIEELIGEKRFFYQDHGQGIRLFRSRDEVNAASPYRLAISETDADSDVNIATRIRIEGSDVYETFDEAMLIQHGNLFRLVHMNEVNSPAEAQYYGGVVMDELGSRYRNQGFSGAADPRIEPNDIVYVQLPSGVVKVIVDSVEYSLNITDTSSVFDMNINGRVPRSSL